MNCLRLGALVAACLCLSRTAPAAAASAEVAEPDSYRMDHYRAPVPATIRGGSVVHVEGLSALIESLHPVLIDVLPAPTPPPDQRAGLPRLPLPNKDIPNSLWLPETGRGALTAQTEAWFQAKLQKATDGHLAAPIVFYCLSNCWMSWNATRRAISYGYTHAIWFPEGADGWAAAGHPLQIAVPAR